jgi:tetratricopeptide (TPR) repeat protein
MPLGELEADLAPARRRAAHHRRRARTLAQQGDSAQALQELDAALLELPDVRTLRARGLIYYRLGDYDRTLADLNAALSRERDGRALHIRARIFYRCGDYDRALNDLTAVIRSDPKAETAYRLRARIHRLLAGQDRETAAQLASQRTARPKG